MSRLERAFRLAAEDDRAAFVAYVTAGDPDLDTTKELVLALANAGADVIELGVPFSDPIADGPTNQLAAERGLASGTTLSGVLECLAEMRADGFDGAVVLFTYANPVIASGDGWAQRFAAAGVDGLLFTDVPAEEIEMFSADSQPAGLDLVMLVTPTSTDERIRRAAEIGGGFLYLVSRTGVTGARAELPEDLGELIERTRSCSDLPIAVGFGVSTPEQVSTISRLAEGVVVGSALVRRVAEHGREAVQPVADLARTLVTATRRS